MFEWILGVELSFFSLFFLSPASAGVTLRVIGRRAAVGECRITENERVELCAQQAGPSYRQVTVHQLLLRYWRFL